MPRSSLVVVGHGASNLAGPGFSGCQPPGRRGDRRADGRCSLTVRSPAIIPGRRPSRHHLGQERFFRQLQAGWPAPWPMRRVVPSGPQCPGTWPPQRAAARYARSRSPAAAHSSAQRPQATAASLVHSASASRTVCRPALRAASAQRIARRMRRSLRAEHRAARVVHDLHPGLVRRPPLPDLGPDPRVPQSRKGAVARSLRLSGIHETGAAPGERPAGRRPAPASPRRSGGTARAGPSAQRRATVCAGRSRPGSAGSQAPSAVAPGHHRAGRFPRPRPAG